MLKGETLQFLLSQNVREVFIVDGWDIVSNEIYSDKFYEIKTAEKSINGEVRVFLEECIVNEPFVYDDSIIGTNKCENVHLDVPINVDSSINVQVKNDEINEGDNQSGEII